MIASEPNAKEKGVSPVAHLLVVQYTHRHPSSSSGNFPFLLARDYLVGCFGLPIVMRISRHGHMLLDAILLEELRHIFAHELRSVVSDDGLKDAKLANDVPLYEMFYVHLSRGRLGFCFYPFGEVIDCHDHHASTSSSRRHRSYQANCHCMNNQVFVCRCSSLLGSDGTDL
ncbi:hypothetical protein ACFXTI_014281 [Malus domestica]